ncbi:hypothetical protein ACQJBY_049782 [Aegilops geniculata]
MFAATRQSVSRMKGSLLHSRVRAIPSMHAATSASSGLAQYVRNLQEEKMIAPPWSRRIIPAPPVPSSSRHAPSTLSLFQPAGGFAHRSEGLVYEACMACALLLLLVS